MSNQPFATPLLSWDIFLEGYRRSISLARDVQVLNEYARLHEWKIEWDLQEELMKKQAVVLVTNTSQKIDFASSNLLTMNGYFPDEVKGKTPRIFQGKATDSNVKSEVRDAIAKWIPFSVTLINYRKNGLTYKCRVDGFPVFNKRSELVNFIAFEKLEHYDF